MSNNTDRDKQINGILTNAQKLTKYVEDLREIGVNIEPPRPYDETVTIPVNCWFDKKFFISLYLLRYHKIAGIKISYHEMPQLQIQVNKSNLELIIRASSLATLQGGSVETSDWQINSKATPWKKDYTYLNVYELIKSEHPYYWKTDLCEVLAQFCTQYLLLIKTDTVLLLPDIFLQPLLQRFRILQNNCF